MKLFMYAYIMSLIIIIKINNEIVFLIHHYPVFLVIMITFILIHSTLI